MEKSKFSITHKDESMVELVRKTDHKTLAVWAVDCVERIMPYFEEKYTEDHRPRNAIETLRAWIKTESVGETGGDGANICIAGAWEKSPSLQGTKDWTPVWCTFFSAAREKVELHCRLGFYGQGCTGTAYFDDVEMRESPGDPREQQVSLLEQEASLQQHLRALQDQLWMPVRIDEDAMKRLGIDIDQPLTMDGKERNGNALDVVKALLSQADPNGRLTMTLKQYHGIDNVMLITSK